MVLAGCGLSSASGRGVKVSSADAARHHLSAMGFEFVLAAGVDWSSSLFPDPGTYVSASGPPGGPLFIGVQSFNRGTGQPATLAQTVSAQSLPSLVLGTAAKVQMAGVSRQAQSYTFGKGNFRTHGCAVLIPRAPSTEDGLVVTFWVGLHNDSGPDCQAVLRSRDLAPTAESFRLN